MISRMWFLNLFLISLGTDWLIDKDFRQKTLATDPNQTCFKFLRFSIVRTVCIPADKAKFRTHNFSFININFA